MLLDCRSDLKWCFSLCGLHRRLASATLERAATTTPNSPRLRIIAFAVSLLFALRFQGQTTEPTFPKGELSTAKTHTGNIWLSELNVGDSTFDPSIAQAVYGPGAKLDWHIHPGGQVLLITEGTGYYQ